MDWSPYLAGVVAASVDSIVMTSRDGTILGWNPAAERLYGYSETEAIGSSILMVLSETEHQRTLDLLDATFRGAGAGFGEGLRRRKDQTYVYVSDSIFPVRGENGEVIAACGIAHDITRRKQTEELLRLREAQLRAAQALGQMGSWAWDLRTDTVNWSDELFRMVGWEPSPVALTLDDVMKTAHPEDRSRLQEVVRKLLVDHRPFNLEYRLARSDGTLHTVMARGEAHLGPDGKPTQIASTLQDITERKQIEHAFVKAKEEAEAASRAKSEFLANTSHEIRTPLNGVIGMVEVLLDTPLDAQQTEFLGIALESAESLLALLEDVLDFSKMQAGRLDLYARPFDAEDLISSTAAAFALRAHEKNLELIVHIAPALREGLVVGDPNRIRQVLVNLVGNAVKFTEQGEIVIRAGLAAKGDEEATLEVTVRDTGIGISTERVDMIFEEFSQVDTAPTRRHGGTGLGLAICVRLIHLMGGDVAVESEAEVGSTFRFTIPVGRAAAAPQPTPGPPMDAASKRILVVDDNETNRRVLEEMLERWGFRATITADAESGLAAFREAHDVGDPFDLAIIDRAMPSRDGFSVAAEMAENSPPILVMLSSSDYAQDRARAADLAIGSYLLKPVRQPRLYEELMRLLQPDSVKGEDAGEDVVASSPVAEVATPVPSLRVLLVEDNAVNRRLQQVMLERRGHGVDMAHDGADGVSRYSSANYDLVLMDVQMPGMDGMTATREIRRIEREWDRLRTPIIALTARAMPGDREQCFDSGMDGYLSKPLRQAVLDDEIVRVVGISGEKGHRTGPPPPQDEDLAVFDQEGLLELVAGDRSILAEVVSTYLEGLPGYLAEIADSLAENDMAGAQAAAHALKGSSASLRADRMAAAVAQLERAVRTGDSATADAAHREVEGEARELQKHLGSVDRDFA